MEPLPDGTYEALVIDVGPASDGGARYEMTLLRGEHKGSVVAVSDPHGDPDDVGVLGVGATLVVRDGRPSVELETP